MKAEGYSLDLYCENNDPNSPDPSAYYWPHPYYKPPHQYFGESRASVYRQARRDGWVLTREGFVYCPFCTTPIGKQRGFRRVGTPKARDFYDETYAPYAKERSATSI